MTLSLNLQGYFSVNSTSQFSVPDSYRHRTQDGLDSSQKVTNKVQNGIVAVTSSIFEACLFCIVLPLVPTTVYITHLCIYKPAVFLLLVTILRAKFITLGEPCTCQQRPAVL